MVTLVIPQHGRSELTLGCLRSFLEWHRAYAELSRIVVVDDGSSSPHLRRLQAAILNGVEMLALRERVGVTAAWNAALRTVRTPLVVLLNNDTLTTGAWLPDLIKPLQGGDEGGPMLCGNGRRIDRDVPSSVRALSPQGLLEGWCLAARTSTLRELGGLDERFRWYFSDTDLQCRMLLCNRRALSDMGPLAIRHLQHRTTHDDPRRAEIWQRDRERFVRKWG